MMYDVIILGAGPAGLAAAIRAGELHLQALVLDKYPSEAHKVCGDGLTANCISVLSDLGISKDLLVSVGGWEIQRSLHIFSSHRAQILYPPASTFTLHRPILLQLMRARASELGVEIIYNWKGIINESPLGFFCTESACAKYLINAAGCQTNSWAKSSNRFSLPVGVAAIISGATSLSNKTFYFLHHRKNDAGYCWAFPLNNNQWNVGTWQEYDVHNVKSSYQYFEAHYLNHYFQNWKYDTVLRGARLGVLPIATTQNPKVFSCGDAAGNCKLAGGEGITGALQNGKSVVEYIVALI